jgi:hypothetical protein
VREARALEGIPRSTTVLLDPRSAGAEKTVLLMARGATFRTLAVGAAPSQVMEKLGVRPSVEYFPGKNDGV